uniref:Uncharacterized protein n=2 Tax=Ciona intestinalis TaxID=7719 RepID=F6RGV2_CIOIN
MVYYQDMGIGRECEAMMEHVQQQPLPNKMSQKVNAVAGNKGLPDVCDAVRAITLAITYLAKFPGNPDQPLLGLFETLQVNLEERALVPKETKLQQLLSLYEHLSWHRSMKFVKVDGDPFENVLEEENREEIKDIETFKDSLVPHLEQIGMELNSFIFIKARGLDHNMSLRDSLQEYMNGKDNGKAAWLKLLPQTLKLKHSIHLFQVVVKSMKI